MDAWIEIGLIRGGLLIAAIIILIVTRSRWSNDLYIPKSLGRWFLASLWLVYPLAFWFAGIAMENGAIYSGKGFLILSTYLLVLWLVSGFPHIFLGSQRALKSWAVRIEYARRHNLPHLDEKIIRDLYPKLITESPNYRLRNVLEVNPAVSIATAFKSKRLVRGSTLSRLELIIIEGVPDYGSIIASKKRKPGTKVGVLGKTRKTSSVLDDYYIEVEGFRYLVLVPTSLKEVRLSANQGTPELSLAKETAESILKKLGRQDRALLSQVAGLYLNSRRMIFELNEFLDTENKLALWVNYVKNLRQGPVII